jgi:hypothetical protein
MGKEKSSAMEKIKFSCIKIVMTLRVRRTGFCVAVRKVPKCVSASLTWLAKDTYLSEICAQLLNKLAGLTPATGMKESSHQKIFSNIVFDEDLKGQCHQIRMA